MSPFSTSSEITEKQHVASAVNDANASRRNEQDARDREQQLKQYGAARGHLKARIKRSMTEELESAGEARCPSPRECRP